MDQTARRHAVTDAKGFDFPRLIGLALGVAAAITGSNVALSQEQTLALAVGLAGVYQLISRYVLLQESQDLGVPDARHFFGTTTTWAAMGNAVIALVVMFGGLPEAVPLPQWFLAVAQLGAFVLSQDRLTMAGRKLTNGAARSRTARVAYWRKA